jgi:Bacterial Ig-like domain (group 3)/IPT/TIG domain
LLDVSDIGLVRAGTAAREFFAGLIRRRIPLSAWAALATIALACAASPAFAQSPPNISVGFGPIGIEPNFVSTLSIALSNPNASITLTGVAFTDNLPANLVVATPNGLVNTCGGVATATAGSASISFTGGTIAPGGSCSITVNVTSFRTGTYVNTAGPVSSDQASGGTATASLAVANPPTISTLFLPDSIISTGTTLLSFTLTNPNSNSTPPNSNVSLDGVGFTDSLPAGLVIASPNGLSNSCGGTVTAVSGTSSLSLTGGNIPPLVNENGGECFISLLVTAKNAGVLNNTTGPITSNQSGLGATSNTASLTVKAASPPTISNSFGAASIVFGGSTTLSFVISNSNYQSLTGVGFTDALPSGLVVSTPNGLTNNCGGTATATAGSSSISLSGANVPSGTCNLSVNVTGTGIGMKSNTTGPITSDATGPAAPSNTATIAVTQSVTSTPIVTSLSPNFGPSAGGTSVTITGANLTGATAVKFGNTAAASFAVNSANSITATSPPGTGTVDVTVTTGDGTSATSAGDQFSFKVATTTSLSSSQNPSIGGQPVTFTAKVTGASPTGVVTFLDGGAAIGTATLAAGTAAFTTSLAAGTHSITAAYGGDGGNAPSVSAVLVQTVNIPAASIRLREMELLTMPVAAQIFGQAVTGSTNAAISAGFNGNPQPLTMSGNGITYYFGADPETEAATDSSRGDSVKRFVASPDGSGGVFDRNLAGSRFDDDFNALGYAGPTKAPPKPAAQPRDWLAWIDVRGTQFNRNPSATANSTDLLGGATRRHRRLDPPIHAGLSRGSDRRL